MIGFLLLAAHCFGDGPLQNEWMQAKVRSSFVCTVHVLTYSIPFLLLVFFAGLPFWALALIFCQHWMQDRWSLHIRWIYFYGQTPPECWHVAFLGLIAFLIGG